VTLEQLKDRLHQVVAPFAGGRTVIWMRQDGPRPAEQYVGLYHPRMIRESEPEEQQQIDSGVLTQDQRIHYSVMLDVEVFRGLAMEVAWEIQRGLYLMVTRERLGDVALVNIEAPIDTTTILDRQWEQRARFTAQFRVAVVATELLDWIETVNLKRAPGMPGASP
jgi:hypothetical protein